MAKTNNKHVSSKSTAASILTQKDADQYRVAVTKYAKEATSSKAKARKTLISLGTHTKSGKLSRKYG